MLGAVFSETADVVGFVWLNLKNNTTAGESRRRVERRQTIDNGVTIIDSGYTEGDRTLDIRWVPTSEEVEATIARLVRTYTRICVSLPAGVFLGVPEVYTPGADESALRVLVLSKLSV